MKKNDNNTRKVYTNELASLHEIEKCQGTYKASNCQEKLEH